MLLLAPLRPEDSEEMVNRKLALVARYVDILITWRLWNFRSIAYSTMQYAAFLVMREIRGLGPDALAVHLHDLLGREGETFASNDRLRVHQQNRYALHRILARMTDYIEVQSGEASRYGDYVNEGKTRYEIEHIWANHWRRHEKEFGHPADFAAFRNRLGGLLLLPKSVNASLKDLSYAEKLPYYNTENLLARSLHSQCYQHNPGFRHFRERTRLPFVAHEEFVSADLEQRSELYRMIAERVWNPDDLLEGDVC